MSTNHFLHARKRNIFSSQIEGLKDFVKMLRLIGMGILAGSLFSFHGLSG